MTDYQVFKINCPTSMSEILIAELADIGFEGFIENEEGFDAYMVKDAFDEDLFYGLCEKYGIAKDMVKEENIPAQNWNAIWEADFEPIIIDRKSTLLNSSQTCALPI